MNFIKKCLLTVMAMGFATSMLHCEEFFTKVYLFKNETKGAKTTKTDRFVFLKENPYFGDLVITLAAKKSLVNYFTKKPSTDASSVTSDSEEPDKEGFYTLTIGKCKTVYFKCIYQKDFKTESSKYKNQGFALVETFRVINGLDPDKINLEPFETTTKENKKSIKKNIKKEEKKSIKTNTKPSWKKWALWGTALAVVGTVAGTLIYKYWNQLKR